MKRIIALVAVAALALPVGLMVVIVLVLTEHEGHATAGGTDVITDDMAPPEYVPLLRQAAADCEHGLSAVILAAQIEQESGWNADAVSPAGAQGIAQFMPQTWSSWGQGGDPFKPDDAIPAQGRLMCSLLGQARASTYPGAPIELALAGYNAGWGRVQEYRGVPPESFAGGETYHYVRIIMANAARLGAQGVTGSAWQLPVDAPLGAQYRQTSALWSSGYHTGVDFTAASGTPVYAAAAGTVVSASRTGGAYGTEVVIRHAEGIHTQYAHLSSLSVSNGQSVGAGEQIGSVGSTGNSTGPHLHFEVRTGPAYGSDMDPVVWLRQQGVRI